MSARAGRARWPAFPVAQYGKLRQVRFRELAVRFVFGAVITVAAELLSRAFGARFGGSFLAFPAILPASLTLIQQKEGTRRADRNVVGAVLGGAGLLVFAMIGKAAFGHIEAFATLALAAAGWLACAVSLYWLLAFLRPGDCDRTKD